METEITLMTYITSIKINVNSLTWFISNSMEGKIVKQNPAALIHFPTR